MTTYYDTEKSASRATAGMMRLYGRNPRDFINSDPILSKDPMLREKDNDRTSVER